MGASFGRKHLSEQRPSLEAPPRRYTQSTRFDVTPHPLKMFMVVALGLGVVPVLLVKLLDPRPMLLNGLIQFSAQGADIFYGILILASLAFAGAGIVGFVRSLGDKVWVTLDANAISGPSGMAASKSTRIAYNEIARCKMRQYRQHQWMDIKASDGRKIRVGSAVLRQEAEWPEFLAEFDRRLTAAGHR